MKPHIHADGSEEHGLRKANSPQESLHEVNADLLNTIAQQNREASIFEPGVIRMLMGQWVERNNASYDPSLDRRKYGKTSNI